MRSDWSPSLEGGDSPPAEASTIGLTTRTGVTVTSLRPAAAVIAALAISMFVPRAAEAAVPVHVIKTDLKPLIRAGYESPVQFAVLVPHAASVGTSGRWTVNGERATWTYAVRIPTAVSMSFHATHVSWPESAVLSVRGAKTTLTYRAFDVHRGELWSRVHPGDTLQFTLTVASADRARVRLDIVSLQAGYRSLGSGVEDHPLYRQLRAQRAQAAATGNSSCVTNYQCEVTSNNTPPGSATVVLVIGNLYLCTGSLLNDVPEDNVPYVLTARHCESGQLGGGNPGAASTVTVYWDATTACGTAVVSIYDSNFPRQTGAQTVIEQQDAWLIRLDASPAVTDAQFAGFDASGGAVQGGYTIHHAEGNDKQFTAWFGQAYAVHQGGVLGTSYQSDFWETVNQLGNIGPGTSGSGLFDQNDHLVGSASLGRTTPDPTGYEACPVAPLAAPNGSNGVADFTSLAAVWNSTADTTSTTNPATLQSVLDPGSTGTLVVASLPVPVMTFTSLSLDRISVNQNAQFQWSAPSATQCTPSGGVAGDGWSGTLPNTGAQAVTETAFGVVTYTLTCAFPGGHFAHQSLTVDWIGAQTQLWINTPFPTWTTRPAVLGWSSNNGPCSITGGGLSLSNLPAAGTTTATQSNPGDVTYTFSCGPTDNSETVSTIVTYVTPSLAFEANGTDRLLGQPLTLAWATWADSCIPSGGAPGDGWSNSAFAAPTSGTQFTPHITATGTYTYTLNCSSGPLSVQQSLVVTVENNAPFVTTSFDRTSVTLSNSPADYMTMTWLSNLTLCTTYETPGMPSTYTDPIVNDPIQPQNPIVFMPTAPGTYTVSVNCTSEVGTPNMSATSSPITLTVLPPPPPTATISFTPAQVAVNQNFTINWSSTNALDCAETGGAPGSIWGAGGANNFGDPATGSAISSVNEPGVFTFGITCNSIDTSQGTASAHAILTVGTPAVTLSVSPTSVTNGSTLTLSWSGTSVSSCTASGGGANGSAWSGTLPASGSATQTASVNGTFTYTITCDSKVQAQATVTVSAPGGGGGAGGGGGGGLGLLELGSLAALAGLRIGRRRGLGQEERSARSL